jgi:hypothetical protein
LQCRVGENSDGAGCYLAVVCCSAAHLMLIYLAFMQSIPP